MLRPKNGRFLRWLKCPTCHFCDAILFDSRPLMGRPIHCAKLQFVHVVVLCGRWRVLIWRNGVTAALSLVRQLFRIWRSDATNRKFPRGQLLLGGFCRRIARAIRQGKAHVTEFRSFGAHSGTCYCSCFFQCAWIWSLCSDFDCVEL